MNQYVLVNSFKMCKNAKTKFQVNQTNGNPAINFTLLELTGHQWPSLRYAILQPVTFASATLLFLSDAVGSAIFPSAHSSNCLTHPSEKSSSAANNHIISETITQLPLLYSDHLTSPFGHEFGRRRRNSVSRFNPAVLEPWYNPACCTASADAIISSLPAKSAFRENEERKLLKQLRNFYLSADGSQPVNKVGFCSPRTKRYIARQHRESDSSFAAQKSLQPARELEVSKSENSLGVKPLKKTRSYANTPNKKANRSTVTLAKKGNRTPRRTPRKRSGRTPRKSSRLTPAKAKRTPAKSYGTMSTKLSTSTSMKPPGAILTKPSGGMWRANLILQKSREAMMAKKTSSLKDDGGESASSHIKPVSHSAVKEQFTTTGWQDISSEEALVSHLKVMYDKVVEGEGTPLIGAKSIVTSSMHFYRNSGELNVPKSTCGMLRQHFLLKMPDLHAKYKGLTDCLANKLTEYQLQVLLRMELEAECSTQCDDDAGPFESTEQLDEVVRILQAISFIKDPGFLSSYLSDTLLLNYCDSSPRFLYQIYSQLILPIPSQLEHLRTPEETDTTDQSVPIPPSTLTSVSAAVKSGETQADANRQRKLYRSVTFTHVTQRRIEVPLKKPQAVTPARRSSRIASASKTKINHTADVSETKKVRRMLFDGSEADRRQSLPSALPQQKSEVAIASSRRVSDVFRTPKKSYQGLKAKVISETPAHKQGNRLQMKLELRQKRLSMDPSSMVVVAESPVKYSSDTVPTVKGGSERSEALKRESFYSGRQSKYIKLEQRMTQRVCSPPTETISANYVAGSWLTSPRRITPKALFGALLSPSPDKAARNTVTQRLATSCRPEAIDSSSGAATVSAAELVSPSRNTRSQMNRLSQPQKESIQSPRAAHAPIDDAAAAAQKELTPANRSAGRIGLRKADAMSGDRRRVAFCRVLLPRESPEFTSKEEKDDGPVASAEWPLSEVVPREPPRVESNSIDGSNIAATTSAATPVSKGKRLIKTPDSLDKWPRKKNRALMSRSPTPTSAVQSTSVAAAEAGLDAVRPSAVTETAVGQRRSESQKSECIVAIHRLSNKFRDKADAVSLKDSTDPKPKRAEIVTSSLAGRGVKRKWSGTSACTAGVPVYRTERRRVWTVDGCCDSGVAKSLELFGTDVDDVDDVRPSSSNATRCRERTTQQKNENVESNDERKRMRRTRLAEPRWSSGFSSASHNSLSERSPSPIFPSTSQCSVADDLASLVAVAESEVDTKGQMSPVFDKSLQNSSAFEDPGTGLAGTADQQLLSEGKSFSPNLTNSSLMHLITSPLLNVADGKFRKYSSRGSSRRCLDEQMSFAANLKS